MKTKSVYAADISEYRKIRLHGSLKRKLAFPQNDRNALMDIPPIPSPIRARF